MRAIRFLLSLCLLFAVSAASAQQPPKGPPRGAPKDAPVDPAQAAPTEPARDALPPGENLQLAMPPGWELGYSDRDDDQAIYEYVPAGQDVETWREMITVQIFFGLTNAPPRAFLERMRKGFESECEAPGAEPAADRRVNGFAAARQLLLCGKGKRGGKGEATLVQVVGGRDSLYVVQRAWRGDAFRGVAPPAARALLPVWQQHLDSMRVCDTRDKERPCN